MLESLHAILKELSSVLWGWPALVLLVGTGVMMTIALKGMAWWRLPQALWMALGPNSGKSSGEGTISNRAALMTALANTVGTGNIAGVATAIALGGPGAMFWMWMSGLLGMAVKYSEALLGVYFREKKADGEFHGGPMYYLAQGVGLPWLGVLYGLLLCFASLCIGSMVQSNSIASAMQQAFNVSPSTTSLIVMLIAALVLLGGLKSVARVADKLVPSMILVYLLAGSIVLLLNAGAVPAAFQLIFTEAFNFNAAAGGAAGAAVMAAMRYGLARGVFSNESGLGTAGIAAATAKTKHPTEQALISMTQTFIDTIIVCTFTGMVIIVSGAWISGEATGAALTGLAFSHGLGGVTFAGIPVGSAVVAICLAVFAFTSVIGSGYYGQQGALYVFGKRAMKPFLVMFLIMVFMGGYVLELAGDSLVGIYLVWTMADIATALMIFPNLIGLWYLRGLVVRLSKDYFKVENEGGTYTETPFYADKK